MKIDDEMKDLLEEYKYSNLFRNYSVRYNKKIGNKYWASIKNNDDIEKTKQRTENIINYYKTVYPLVNDDIEEIELEIGKYERAISKIIQCYDNPNCNFSYTKDELMQLINNLDVYEEQLSDIRMKKACQD